MASAIKVEVDQISPKSLCHGCLSQDRKLKPLTGENYRMYYCLLGSGMLYNLQGSEDRMVCWECEATLRRAVKFQTQIFHAQNKIMEMFYNMNPQIQSLSNLSIATRDHYDLYYEFIEQTFIQVDTDLKPNEFIPETVPEPKINTDQPTIKEYEVKIENIEPKRESSNESDDDFHEETNNLVIDIKENEVKKETKEKDKKNNKTTYRDLKYHVKYAIIKDLNKKFDKAEPYFVEDAIELEQVNDIKPELTNHRFKHRDFKMLSLKDQYLYKLHKNLNQVKPDSPTVCLLCKKKLSNLDQLRRHWKSTHCPLWRCILCNSYCRKSGRVNHLKGQHTKVYSCTKCRREFRCKVHFNIHFKKDHDTYICHHCGKVCGTRTKIVRHMLAAHADEYLCKICNKNFKDQYNLMRHCTVYHPEVLNKKVDLEAAYCVECNKQFKTVELFKRHLFDSPKHTKRPTQSVPCPECGKIFTRKTYMKNHFNKEHMIENAKHKCTICEKIFTNSSGLKRHYQNVHLKIPRDKNKICDICGRGFHTNRILANHRRTHTGERPYSCDYCSATFTQQTPMVNHQFKCSFQRTS